MSCCTVLHEVTGTGPNGRITKKDAEQARTRVTQTIEQNSAPHSDGHAPANSLQRTTNGTGPVMTLQPGATGGRRDASAGRVQTGQAVTAIEHTRIRRAVATRPTASKQTIPHFYVRRSARINDLMRLRAELNEASKQRISINDMVIRAVAVAHKQIPEANLVWTDPSMRHFDDVDVGVAIASEEGLVTPVLRSIQDTTPSGIARRVQQFVQQANAGNLAQRDLEGGSITVTNLGMYGVEEFAAIINPPQSAILAVGAGRSKS